MLIYNIADTYFIGQTGNPKMISAISLSMPVFTVLSGIGTLFGNGGTTSISIALGEGNREKVQKITTFCFFGSVTVGCLFFLMIFAFTQPLALLLGADETTPVSYTHLDVYKRQSFYFVFPRHSHRRSVMQYNDRIFLHITDLLDQIILTVRKIQMLPVIPLRFKIVRQSGEDDGNFSLLSNTDRFILQFFIYLVDVVFKSSGKCHLSDFPDCLHRRFHFPAVDVGTSAALIPRCLGIFSDKGNFLFLCKRKNLILIL